jgi:hypothetical protein
MIQDQPPDDNVEWETPERRRPRRLDEETEDVGFPIVWVLIGGLAALLTIGLVALGLVRIFTRSGTTAAVTPSALPTTVLPTPVTVTALVVPTPTTATEPTVAPTPKPKPTKAAPAATPTPMPPTPTPVPPQPVAPTKIQVGGYVRIVNTEGAGLSLRKDPSRQSDRLGVAAADSVVPVVDGPQNDREGETDENGAIYQWWYLRATDGTEGWGRADFLEPAPPP